MRRQSGKESAYEVLGFQAIEPGTKPPLLRASSGSRPLLNRMTAYCVRPLTLLKRARPQHSLSAAFFDRLEVLRKVMLAEIAKADDTLTTMAATGVAFDRKAPLVSAEEVFGVVKAKALVLQSEPGDYADIAMG